MGTATAEAQVVKDAEKVVADAAKAESKGKVNTTTAQPGTARAWDAQAQVD